jgi:hypothetical protein
MAAVIAVGVALVIAAVAALVAEGLVTGRPAATGRTGTAGAGARPGRIVGVIAGCPGALTYPLRIPTVGGIVTLLRGRLAYKEIRPGVRAAVIPLPVRRAVVASEPVRPGHRFWFREPAGHYVVSALAGDRESGFFRYPPVAVSLRSGVTVRLVTGTACA